MWTFYFGSILPVCHPQWDAFQKQPPGLPILLLYFYCSSSTLFLHPRSLQVPFFLKPFRCPGPAAFGKLLGTRARFISVARVKTFKKLSQTHVESM